ncbi:hypothetical protein [Micromonospora sp. RP3T]|uniref:hypothetical protein n=1 Tax=Micromonospora sp. RP3T TaxID=2135446 RepID=UPI001304E553|nr:hypothetical protein [Micromonospora sp. RP3T]
MTEPERQPHVIHFGRVETILDPAEVLSAPEPSAEITTDLSASLRVDQAKHPVRR